MYAWLRFTHSQLGAGDSFPVVEITSVAETRRRRRWVSGATGWVPLLEGHDMNRLLKRLPPGVVTVAADRAIPEIHRIA